MRIMLTGEQCRGARAMLGWSQDELAQRAGLTTRTVTKFENGHNIPDPNSLVAMRATLEAAGIEFVYLSGGGGGVLLRSRGP
jgi:transcriptional regulator with XRE-family HTH domain